jgi:hypothetical protein
MITLFAEPRPTVPDPYSVPLSILAHGSVIGLVSLAFMLSPRVSQQTFTQRYSMRLLEMHLPDPPKRPDLKDDNNPAPQPVPRKPAPGKIEAPPPPVLQQLAKKSLVQRTLVQPDAPPDLVLPKDIPIPAVQLWSAEDKAKVIVPPPMQKLSAVKVTPSFVRPNKEEKLADIQISSTAFSTDKLPLISGKSSPVSVQGPELQQPSQIQQTASLSNKQPTGAAVISLSDLTMLEGTTALPRVNQIAAGTPAVRLAPGQKDGSGQQGNGAGDGSEQGGNPASGSGSGSGKRPATKRVTPPKNGKFTMVLVGNSVEGQYPETSEMWTGRLAYTVYLHVGLPKTWILEYSLPRSADAAAAANSTHLEAPWPTDMVVPNFAPGDINSDALIVHGFLKADGHFEKLSLAFPPQFPQAAFVLDSLQQWQFRPATQNGIPTAVEILIIIPEMMD